MKMKSFIRLPSFSHAVLICALGILLAACQSVSTTKPGAVGIDREQRFLVSAERLQEAATEAYGQQLAEAKQRDILNKDSELTRRVRAIAQRLIPKTAVFRPDAPQWNWEVNTLATDDLNAYVMPGGKMMVYAGLVDRLDLTDAELAAVIGHEMAHALREHSRERVSRQYAQQLALTGAAILTGVDPNLLDLANMVASVTFQLPHSREQESEADIIGLELMARGGYDPRAAAQVWQKMRQQQQDSPPEFLSTHPAPESRIEELQAAVPKVLPLWKSQ